MYILAHTVSARERFPALELALLRVAKQHREMVRWFREADDELDLPDSSTPKPPPVRPWQHFQKSKSNDDQKRVWCWPRVDGPSTELVAYSCDQNEQSKPDWLRAFYDSVAGARPIPYGKFNGPDLETANIVELPLPSMPLTPMLDDSVTSATLVSEILLALSGVSLGQATGETMLPLPAEVFEGVDELSDSEIVAVFIGAFANLLNE